VGERTKSLNEARGGAYAQVHIDQFSRASVYGTPVARVTFTVMFTTVDLQAVALDYEEEVLAQTQALAAIIASNPQVRPIRMLARG
jgi:hypothetical protein